MSTHTTFHVWVTGFVAGNLSFLYVPFSILAGFAAINEPLNRMLDFRPDEVLVDRPICHTGMLELLVIPSNNPKTQKVGIRMLLSLHSNERYVCCWSLSLP